MNPAQENTRMKEEDVSDKANKKIETWYGAPHEWF